MPKKPLLILTIDDDPGCRLAAARFLTLSGGHMVETAENGREGLKKAAQLRPDVILLDMNMPGMNGLEVMQTLYADAATRDIPVIIVTGSSLSDAEQDSLKAGDNFMLLEQKPADFNKLLKIIETLPRAAAARPAARKTVLRGSLESA